MKRRRQPVALRAFEVYLGNKTIQADAANVSAGILMYVVDSLTTYIPVKSKVEIFCRMPAPQMEVPRRAAYDPQLPHNENGNLSLEQLEQKERQRELAVKAFAEDRKNELDALANGATPFIPRFVGQ